MKKCVFQTFVVLALVMVSFNSGFAGKLNSKCTYKGHKLWGKVQIVTSFPDIKVKLVNAFPDLKVKKVNSFADSCGKWQFVKSFPDLKIQIVDSFADIKVKYVSSFPGVP